MLSKGSVKLLKWMNKNDELLYCHEIKIRYPQFEDRDFNALTAGKYVDAHIDDNEIPEIDEQCCEVTWPEQYRINSNGKAYLEFQVSNRWKELRNWASLLVAAAAFIKSFFF